MGTTAATVPELEPHCGSWIATHNGRSVELFYRNSAEAAVRCGWTVETAAQYLGRINREIKSAGNHQRQTGGRMSYRTFKRSCTNWKTFARARKITDETGLSFEEAQRRCREFNENRTAAQIRRGTKLEFEQQ